MDGRPTAALLATSSGFAVAARDGEVGVVETPLFPPDETTPDFLVLRVGRVRPRRPVLAVALVDRVDPAGRVVHVRATRDEVRGLPEHLPLAL